MVAPLALDEIRLAVGQLANHVVRTPVHRLQSPEVEQALGVSTETWLKLELFQRTGTFKARGALLNVLALSEQARKQGVTAVSAGNHAAAVAFAAATAGISAKVVMFASANDDEAQFECPRELDVDRHNTQTHLTFGMGIHRCVGAPLARMEIRVAAQEIIRRLEDIKLAIPVEQLSYVDTLVTQTLDRLPLTFRRAS